MNSFFGIMMGPYTSLQLAESFIARQESISKTSPSTFAQSISIQRTLPLSRFLSENRRLVYLKGHTSSSEGTTTTFSPRREVPRAAIVNGFVEAIGVLSGRGRLGQTIRFVIMASKTTFKISVMRILSRILTATGGRFF